MRNISTIKKLSFILAIPFIVSCSSGLISEDQTSSSSQNQASAFLVTIQLESLPFKTVYYPNEVISLNGSKIRYFLSDGTSYVENITNEMINFNNNLFNSPGTYNVNVNFNYNNLTKSTTFPVNVVSYEVMAQELNLNFEKADLKISDRVQLMPNVIPFNSNFSEIVYVSSNQSVAHVSESGLITALQSGIAIITARISGTNVEATASVKVEMPTNLSTGFRSSNSGAASGDYYLGLRHGEEDYLDNILFNYSRLVTTNSTAENDYKSGYLNGYGFRHLALDTDFLTGSAKSAYISQKVSDGYTPISNVSDILGISSDLTGSYILTQSLNLIDEWVPLGSSSTPFTGVFDGGFNTISNLTIVSPSNSNIGLFGATSSAMITNIKLVNPFVVGNENVGALVGAATDTEINNIIAEQVNLVGRRNSGGLIGNLSNSINDLEIHNLTVGGEITGKRVNGGIIGYFVNTGNNLKLENIINQAGNVNSDVLAGGIVGYMRTSKNVSSIGIINHSNVVAEEDDDIGTAGGFFGEVDLTNLRSSQLIGVIGYEAYSEDPSEPFDGQRYFNTTDNKVYEWVLNYDGQNNNGWIKVPFNVGDLIFEPENLQLFEITSANDAEDIFSAKTASAGQIVAYYINDNVTKALYTANESGVFELTDTNDLIELTFNIKNSANYGNISSFDDSGVGGFIGEIEHEVENSVSDGLTGTKLLIEDSYNMGIIFSEEDRVGGLVGASRRLQEVIISNSFNKGIIFGDEDIAGLIGYSNREFNISILNSFNTAKVNGSDQVAGLVGRIDAGRGTTLIENSFNIGDVSSRDDYQGGLIAYFDNSNNLKILNSLNTGDVTSEFYYNGGLVGRVQSIYGSLEIINSNNFGDVSSEYYYNGGLVGAYEGRSNGVNRVILIENSNNYGRIYSSTHGENGGLIGYLNRVESIEIKDSNNRGNIIGSRSQLQIMNQGVIGNFVGGIIGYVGLVKKTLTITNVVNYGRVVGINSLNNPNSFAGGFIGYISTVGEKTTIDNSENFGNVYGEGSYVGGLIGFVSGDFEILNSSNSGSIYGLSYVGGLFGASNLAPTIVNSVSTDNVNSHSGGSFVDLVGTVLE